MRANEKDLFMTNRWPIEEVPYLPAEECRKPTKLKNLVKYAEVTAS